MSTGSNLKDFKPFVADSAKLPELTILPLIMGAFLGILFGASSLYLVLKVGLTVSASIPVAVLSITLFRGISKIFGLRQASILENNIVQTTGSAGESIAFGVGVTMPALLILGYDMELARTMIVATLGGLLGVLMMIPLRYALIVRGHGELTYPEGTACAEVLIVGEKGGTSAKTVFMGFFVGLVYKILNVAAKLWTDVPEKLLTWYKGAAISAEVSPELLGVGYIIGPKNSCIMVAGGVLSSLVLIPMIKLFGDGLTSPLYPATKLISQMSISEIWKNYVLYIGAGAVAAGGFISLAQSTPVIIQSIKQSFASLKSRGSGSHSRRTERDLPMNFVLIGSIGLIAAIWLTPSLKMNLLGALLIISFGFLFVTVSSRLTGMIGSSSNPISGMTVATLLLTSLIFLLLGWVGADYRVAALSVAAIVCVAASNGGTTSQDLKTGFLVGGTPRAQQVALLVGAITSALVIGYTLNLLNDANSVYTKKNLPQVHIDVSKLTRTESPRGVNDNKVYKVLQIGEAHAAEMAMAGDKSELSRIPSGRYLVDDSGTIQYLVDPGINGILTKRDDGTTVTKFSAPKARLMSMIIDGILSRKLPWGLVLLGVSISILMEICGVSSLPFAVGVYLPLSSTSPIFVGGMIRWLVDRKNKKSAAESESSPGVLLSSGLIAGGSIAGIGIALFSLYQGLGKAIDLSQGIFKHIAESQATAVIMFTAMCVYLYGVGVKRWLRK